MAGKIRARFAPSPTGLLHIGNVHTAIFTWLFVRHNNGEFVLRIEDTDQDRSSREFEKMLLEDLAWLGLDWDEGVDIGGPYSPYRQTERMNIYQRYAQELLDKGYAYQCFCTPEELEQERDAAVKKGVAPRYSGRCRNLSEQERETLLAQGRKPVLRFKTPANEEIVVDDLIRGKISFNSGDLDDFIIVRSNGMPLYNFAVTIDDLTMQITHIIRADEHISNTPRQILLYKAFGHELPVFAHVSMLLGSDRTKLSKRHGATSLREYREKGYLPAALFNYLATLGWSLPDDREFATVTELVELFELAKVGRSPAVFDEEKAAWMNGVYLRQLDLDQLVDLALPYLIDAGFLQNGQKIDRAWLKQLLAVVQDGLTCLSDLTVEAQLFFEMEPVYGEDALQTLRKDGVQEVLAEYRCRIPTWVNLEPEEIHQAMKQVPRDLGIGMGKALRPLRTALTGRTSGPELHQVIYLFGLEKVLQRLDFVLNNLLT